MASGLFERTATHEPKNAPGGGITWALWVDTLGPAPTESGLSATTARITFVIRLYTSMLAEPQDGIDPAMTQAAVDIMTRYSGDFDLGGTVRNVDLLGQTGSALSSKAGYLNQDGRLFRVYDILLPVIVNDVWGQVN
jgi:hypothetical protein